MNPFGADRTEAIAEWKRGERLLHPVDPSIQLVEIVCAGCGEAILIEDYKLRESDFTMLMWGHFRNGAISAEPPAEVCISFEDDVIARVDGARALYRHNVCFIPAETIEGNAEIRPGDDLPAHTPDDRQRIPSD